MNKWTKSILALLAAAALAAWTVHPDADSQDGEPLTIRKLLQSGVGKPCEISMGRSLASFYVWLDREGGESKIAFVGEDFFKVTSEHEDSYIPIAAIVKVITRDE